MTVYVVFVVLDVVLCVLSYCAAIILCVFVMEG